MSLNAWPTVEELETHLTGAGLPDAVVAALDLEGRLDEAVEAIEERSGFRPFLNTASTLSTRIYDPPGGRTLKLGNGLLGAATITRGIAVGVTGVVLTAGEDYWLEPVNALADGKPYTAVRFYREQFGASQSISVRGPFGFATTLKRDIWNACLDYATHLLCPQLGQALRNYYAQPENAVIKRKHALIADIEYQASAKYADGDVSSLASSSLQNFERVLSQRKYVRRKFGE